VVSAVTVAADPVYSRQQALAARPHANGSSNPSMTDFPVPATRFRGLRRNNAHKSATPFSRFTEICFLLSAVSYQEFRLVLVHNYCVHTPNLEPPANHDRIK